MPLLRASSKSRCPSPLLALDMSSEAFYVSVLMCESEET